MEKALENKSARKIMAIIDTIATVFFVLISMWKGIEIPNEWRIQYGVVMTFYFSENRTKNKDDTPPTFQKYDETQILDLENPKSKIADTGTDLADNPMPQGL